VLPLEVVDDAHRLGKQGLDGQSLRSSLEGYRAWNERPDGDGRVGPEGPRNRDRGRPGLGNEGRKLTSEGNGKGGPEWDGGRASWVKRTLYSFELFNGSSWSWRQ